MVRATHQWMQDAEAADDAKPSRSEKKRQALALQKLGEELTLLDSHSWSDLPLTTDLLQALDDLILHTSREARRRHLQYIGRLMRELSYEQIETIQTYLQSKKKH